MHDVMSVSQAGYLDYGFLGAAQLDRFGNINTTVIGPHDAPIARLPGSGARERVGLPADTGPYRVITQLGVYGFDAATREMYLVAVHPGVTVEEIQANSSFPIPVSAQLTTSPAPTAEQQRILQEIDPAGLLIAH
jgi:3-oxoacid CoA-transferase subunit B/glutaconate CoA-transferase subunit B